MSVARSALDVFVTGSVEAPGSAAVVDDEPPPPQAAAVRRRATPARRPRITGENLAAADAGQLEELPEHAVHVRAAVEAEVPLGVERPFGGLAVPGQLEAVAIGITEIERLVRAVVVGAVERPLGRDEPPERVGERLARGVADRDVVEPGRPGRRRRAALRLPGVEAEVMVVAAGGEKERLVADAADDVEAEHADVEVVDA